MLDGVVARLRGVLGVRFGVADEPELLKRRFGEATLVLARHVLLSIFVACCDVLCGVMVRRQLILGFFGSRLNEGLLGARWDPA